MRRFLIPLASGFLLAAIQASATAQSIQPRSPSELYKMASPSVVLIEVYSEDGKVSGSGSGFIVSSDGAIVTNYHVIAHTKRATVRLANDDAYDDVTVLDIDKRKDIALVKIKAVDLPFLKLGRSGSCQVGDKVYALGNPLGSLQNTFSEGILSGIRQADGYRLFQLSTPISHGSSGSPVFDTSGSVIGIIEATIEEGQNLNFAIPIDYALGMISSKDSKPLSAIYEPEPETTKENAAAAVAKAVPQPSEALKNDTIIYLGTRIGVWDKDLAEKEVGSDYTRRDAIVNSNVIGDIYKYSSPAPAFSAIELNFSRSSHKLTAAYLYPQGLISWSAVRARLGKNYKKAKMQNGAVAYEYQFQQRTVSVLVDSAENLISIGTW